MCNLCVYRYCSEHVIATCGVVNYCAGNSNMHSSSFGVPVTQAEPHASTLRHGEKKNPDFSVLCITTCVSVFPDRSASLRQSLTVPVHCVCVFAHACLCVH